MYELFSCEGYHVVMYDVALVHLATTILDVYT